MSPKNRSTPEVRACGVLVFRPEPRSFLLMKHTNRWDLPKGHVDVGESDLECALRELWEETGITPDKIEIDPQFQFETRYVVKSKRTGGKEGVKTLRVFLGWLRQDTPIRVTEHVGFAWFPWTPPHQIQSQTIDPLLSEVAAFLETAS